MFTDMVGYSSSANVDESAAISLVTEQDAILTPILAKHHGRKVKSTGDGFLVEFGSARDAVVCAVDMQIALRQRNEASSAGPIHIRIGINVGDVENHAGDILGDAVNIAARIEPFADPGGVCVSSRVHDQVLNKVPYRIESIGPHNLKGISEPIDLFRVVLPRPGDAPPPDPSRPPRIAVMPLSNISPDPNDAYLADGLTEELISVLSRIQGIRVTSRTSVLQYKSNPKPVRQVGAELDVDAVLEGSVRKAGSQLRITIQLIDVRSDEHRWRETFDRKLDDVFRIQSEVAEETAKALELGIGASEREAIARPPTRNLAAYASYLQGVHAYETSSEGDWAHAAVKSIPHFERAIREDPDFALAHAALAHTLVALSGELIPINEALPRARELAIRAIELDPQLSVAHSALGNVAMQADQDWQTSEREFRTALRLNPSLWEGHFWYGVLLYVLQRYEESLPHLLAALELNPRATEAHVNVGFVYLAMGDYERSRLEFLKDLEARPDADLNRIRLAISDAMFGHSEEARDVLARYADSTDPLIQARVAQIRAVLGEAKAAQSWLDAWDGAGHTEAELQNRLSLMGTRLLAGQRDRVLELLEQDGKARDRMLWFLYQLPVLDPLREDPRFQSLLRVQGLPVTSPPRVRSGLAWKP